MSNACWIPAKYVPAAKRKPKYKVRLKPIWPTEDCHCHSDMAVDKLKVYHDSMVDKAKDKELPKVGMECLIDKIGDKLNNMTGIVKNVYPTGQIDVFLTELGRILRFSVSELCF